MKGALLAGGAVVLLTALGVGLTVGLPTGGGEEPAQAAPTKTAQISRQTLADTETKSGTLGYGGSTSVAARLPGTITAVAAEGAVLRRGQVLYRIDDQPVVLLYGSLPAYRTLRGGLEGADVAQFERQLAALGYTGFTVDDEYTAATATAVRAWQEKLGLPETGVVELGRVAYASDRVRVEAVKVAVGDPVQPGATVLTHTGIQRAVTVEVDVNDERLAARGTAVQVELPDGRRTGGKVSGTRTVIEPGVNGGDPTTSLEVTVALTEPGLTGGFDQATVSVEFTASTREKVLAVPVAALLALREGGYGLELVAGGRSTVVAVQTGLFAGGLVEVSGAGLTEGAEVGMPS